MHPRSDHPTEPWAVSGGDPLARYCKEEGLDLLQLLSSGAHLSGRIKAAGSGRPRFFGLLRGPGR